MAPKPIIRIIMVGLSVLLVVAILATKYDVSPVSSDANGAVSITPIDTLRWSEDNAQKTAKPENANAVQVPPLPDIVALDLDDSTIPRIHKDDNFTAERFSVENQLIPNGIPAVLHFVWCGERYFEFKNYLSIISVMRVIALDRINFFYEHDPTVDQLYYYQWLENIKHDFPFFHMIKMTGEQSTICSNALPEVKYAVLLKLVASNGGGIYVGENTWLLDLQPSDRLVDIMYAMDGEGIDGYFALRYGIPAEGTLAVQNLLDDPKFKTKRSACASVSQYINAVGQVPTCVIVKGESYHKILPMDIWVLDNQFGRLCRKIFYGAEEILQPVPSYDELVPRIGHMVWIGGGEMNYVFYLSVLSMLYIVKVDVVYIHGDMEPAGPHWPKLKNHPRIGKLIKFIHRPEPTVIYGGVVDNPRYYRSLMSDFIRVDLMIKYGGVYTDTDAIWVKGLADSDWGYEAVASFDWVDWSYPYPDSVNFGISYGKRNAPFWRIFRDSMRELHNTVHGFTGVMMPYKLLEKYPNLLRIDNHLSVICYQYRCHPTWVPDYHNMTNDHVNSNSIPNWREDVHAFHWTHPNPPEYANETTLLHSTGLFAEIGRHVLKSAGLL